jgi:hypothetical protein
MIYTPMGVARSGETPFQQGLQIVYYTQHKILLHKQVPQTGKFIHTEKRFEPQEGVPEPDSEREIERERCIAHALEQAPHHRTLNCMICIDADRTTPCRRRRNRGL